MGQQLNEQRVGVDRSEILHVLSASVTTNKVFQGFVLSGRTLEGNNQRWVGIKPGAG